MSFEHEFRDGARFYPQMLDVHQDRVLVVLANEEDYRAASFLDQRMLRPEQARQWLDWQDLAGFAGDLADQAQFIFHIGHVGSTLISRLLGELSEVLALREPLLLRSLADLHFLSGRPESPWPPEQFGERLATALGWLSRTFRPGQRAMVKATSFVGELAGTIVRPERKCLFLFTQPQVYLQTILAGEASRAELASLAGARLQRLHARLGETPWRLWQLSLGERVAMAWVCEMTALSEAAARSSGDDVFWLDFDDFMSAPAEQLAVLAAHFGYQVPPEVAVRLANGPIMNRYAKAPEHAYSAKLRSEVLAAARVVHGEEIRKGLAWLDSAANRHVAIRAALIRSKAGGSAPHMARTFLPRPGT